MVPRPLFAAALALAVAAFHPGSAGASEDAPRLLVELFTSQGCASCRSADAFMDELARRDDLIALSLHVNYWDYIGWKDPFASEAITARQRGYSRRLARGRVFTPQIVVDGVADAMASDPRAVERAIAAARSENRLKIDIEARFDADGGMTVRIPEAAFDGDADVWLARFDREQTTPVARGENAGRTLRSVNVVRALTHIGMWSGKALEIRLPKSVLMAGEGGRDGCVIIVQAADFGPVLGVREVALPSRS